MSIESPVGTLDIKNATLRVGKLEVSNIQGVDTALNVTRANSVLIYDDQASTTTFTGFTSSVGVRDTVGGYLDVAGGYVYWGQKLPNAWVMDFEMDIRSGTNPGPLYANVFSTTNTGGDGYSFTFNDNNDKISLYYDGALLTEATVSGLFTATENWQKVVINYERGLIAISLDGSRKFYYKDIERSTPYVNGEYINVSSASTDGRKIRNLRIVNGEKWVYTGESNIAYTQGSVGIGVTDPQYTLDVGGDINLSGSFYQGGAPFVSSLWTSGNDSLYYTASNVGIGTDTAEYTLDVHGNANVGALTTTSVSGDGSALYGIQSSNVSDFASNVTRIETLETDLGSNVTRIGTLETDLGSNVTRIETLETDLGSNVTRIGTLETDLGSNVTRIGTLETDLGSNVTRIETLETDLGSNVTRIGTLESGDMTISGDKTFSNNVFVTTIKDASNKYLPMVDTDGKLIRSPVYVTGTGKYVITSSEAEFLGNITLSGNTTVVSSNSVTIEDRIFGIGSNNSLTNLDSGIIIEHQDSGVYANVALIHHADEHRFSLGYTQNTFTDDHVLHYDHPNDVVLTLDLRGDVLVQSNLQVGTANLFVDTTTSNVGIGTTTPGYALDVAGDINLSGDFYQGGSIFVSSLWTSGNDSLYYDASNVGIGVNTANYELDVAGNVNATTLLANTAQIHSNLTIGSNVTIDDTASNVISVNGNIKADTFNVGDFLVVASYGLDHVTNENNSTGDTIISTNAITGFRTLSNIVANGNVTATDLLCNTFTMNLVSFTGLQSFDQVINVGNTTSNTVQFTNTNTSLVTLGNVGVGVTNPAYTLDVGDTAPYISVTDTRTSSGGVSGLDLGGIVFRTKDATDPVPETGDFLGKIQMTATNTESFPDGSMNFFVSNRGDLLTTPSITIEGVSGNVGIGTTAPTESLDIVGNINLQKVSNTATIKLDSNVVTEYTRSKKLIKYPRVALTSGASNAYENGYKVTFSNQSGSYQAWEAFDRNGDTVGWYSGDLNVYIGTNGAYSGTTRLASETELGEWIGLEVPTSIKLYDVRIVSQSYSTDSNTVDEFYIYAKKQSGDMWTNLGKFTSIAARQGTPAGVTVNVDSTDYYTFFALIATKRNNTAGGVSIRELEFYGVPEYDPEAHGTDTIMRSIPNVPNTDWLEVYYDAKDLSNGSISSVTDLKPSGTAVNGTVNGSVSVSNGAFTFNGTTDYIRGTLNSVLSDYTFSLWINASEQVQTGFVGIFEMGTRTTNSSTGLYLSGGGKLIHLTYGNNLETSHKVRRGWLHIIGTYSKGDRVIYLNGEMIVFDNYGLLNPSGTQFTIGANNGGGINSGESVGQFFTGSIANFRLFNRNLSGTEIQELYSHQKEYFGVSPNVMSLKNGCLGVGTLEPKATLDIAGTFKCGNSPFRFYHIRGEHLTSVGSQNILRPDDMSDVIISITGVTHNTNEDAVPFERHSDSANWETDVFYDISASAFVISAQGAAALGKPFSLFVVTL